MSDEIDWASVVASFLDGQGRGEAEPRDEGARGAQAGPSGFNGTALDWPDAGVSSTRHAQGGRAVQADPHRAWQFDTDGTPWWLEAAESEPKEAERAPPHAYLGTRGRDTPATHTSIAGPKAQTQTQTQTQSQSSAASSSRPNPARINTSPTGAPRRVSDPFARMFASVDAPFDTAQWSWNPARPAFAAHDGQEAGRSNVGSDSILEHSFGPAAQNLASMPVQRRFTVDAPSQTLTGGATAAGSSFPTVPAPVPASTGPSRPTQAALDLAARARASRRQTLPLSRASQHFAPETPHDHLTPSQPASAATANGPSVGLSLSSSSRSVTPPAPPDLGLHGPSAPPTPAHLTPNTIADTDDKRQRNTMASAKFRAKRKQHVDLVQRTISELETQHAELEKEVKSLTQENGLLREIVQLKYGVEMKKP